MSWCPQPSALSSKQEDGWWGGAGVSGELGHPSMSTSFLRSMFPDSPVEILYLNLMFTVALTQAGLVSSHCFIDTADGTQGIRAALSWYVCGSG